MVWLSFYKELRLQIFIKQLRSFVAFIRKKYTHRRGTIIANHTFKNGIMVFCFSGIFMKHIEAGEIKEYNYGDDG
jgi:hypothetical protein